MGYRYRRPGKTASQRLVVVLLALFWLFALVPDRYATAGGLSIIAILLVGLPWILVPLVKRAPDAPITYLRASVFGSGQRAPVMTGQERDHVKARIIRIRNATQGTPLEGMAITCVQGALNALERGATYELVHPVLLEVEIAAGIVKAQPDVET